MLSLSEMLVAIRSIHEQIRDAVIAATESTSSERLSTVVEDGEGDTIYAIDRISEDLLVDLFHEKIAVYTPIVLIAEGLHNGKLVLPHGTVEQHAQWRVIADPIDGTRCLMYQKRSGWILTGVAPNYGESTSLADIELAVQTEIPLVKQHLSDCLWARRGEGAYAERYNRATGARTALPLRPSTAAGIADGFCSITRFFSGGRDILAAIDDEIAVHATGASRRPGKAYCFEDQYLSTGGQLYELIMGHDRFLADLRPLLAPLLAAQGMEPSLCCHPYDLCTELIARECGIIITNAIGGDLTAPLDLDSNISWAGFANATIHASIEPFLIEALKSRSLLPIPSGPLHEQ